MIRPIFIIFFIFLFEIPSWKVTIAVSSVSPFNNKRIEISDTATSYSFIVTGHLHGSSMNESGFPAASLLGNLGWINSSGATFMVSTGDLFINIRNDILNYRKSFFNNLGIPLFNAVGNHDISGNVYQENFGRTYFSFCLLTEYFIFLDTEENNGSITGDQLSFLKGALKAATSGDIKNLLVFSHRPVWAENDSILKNVFTGNTRSVMGTNFEKEIEPMLQNYCGKFNIFWFSGSLGSFPASFFYYRDQTGITYIQTAIRDLPRDAVLMVHANEGEIQFETASLNNNPVEPVEHYDMQYWKNNHTPLPAFNFRLVPYYVKQMILHYYFWYGILFALVICILVTVVFRHIQSS